MGVVGAGRRFRRSVQSWALASVLLGMLMEMAPKPAPPFALESAPGMQAQPEAAKGPLFSRAGRLRGK